MNFLARLDKSFIDSDENSRCKIQENGTKSKSDSILKTLNKSRTTKLDQKLWTTKVLIQKTGDWKKDFPCFNNGAYSIWNDTTICYLYNYSNIREWTSKVLNFEPRRIVACAGTRIFPKCLKICLFERRKRISSFPNDRAATCSGVTTMRWNWRTALRTVLGRTSPLFQPSLSLHNRYL